MKFTIETKALAAALKRLQPLTGSKTTLPVLKTVLVEASEGKLSLTATDLDVRLRLDVVCAAVEKPGSLAVPCALLMRLAGSIGSEVTCEANAKGMLSLKSGDRKATIMCLPEDEFPPGAKVEGDSVTAPADLAVWISRVLPAASTDGSRPNLGGIFLSGGALAATDGRRLHLVETESKLGDTGVILPTPSARMLGEMSAGRGCDLIVGESAFQASGEGWQMQSKVIEGNFPNFRQVIPADGRPVEVNKAALLSAVDYVRATTTDKSVSVKMLFGPEKVTLSANAPDVGESSAEVPLSRGLEASCSIAFAPDFLCAAVKAFPGDEVAILIIDENSPCKLRGTGFTAVVMPLRIA